MSRLLRTGLNAGDSAPLTVVGGEGVYFHLEDGRRLSDGSNTGGGLGHRHPAMVEAIRRAADTPVVNEGWTWIGREKAADDLISMAFRGEEDWVGAVRFCISGSEANDMALSLCQALTQRTALATRERAYHGLVGLSRSMTVQPHWHGGLAVHAGGSHRPAAVAPVRILPAPDGALYGAPANNPSAKQYLADAAGALSDTAAIISAYLRVVTDEDILSRVRQLEAVFARRLLEIARRHPSVKRVAGQGLHWTIELHGPDWRLWNADTDEEPVASRVASRALEAGAVIGTSGEQTSLFLAPALVISEAESHQLLDALDHGLDVADEAHERQFPSSG